jgi:hypothetical protein
MPRAFWILLLGGFLLAGFWLPLRYPEKVPLAHTGGFGEPTCQACHFDGPLNAQGGSLVLEGVPKMYRTGQRYRLTVQLTRLKMASGGFQLAARFADGRQAGTLVPVDDRVEVMEADSSLVLYAQHTKIDTELAAPDTARWILVWTPPTGGASDVTFHAAANAANDDASAFGDFIYTTQAQSKRHP